MKKKLFILSLSSVFSLVLIYCLHKVCLEQNLKIGDFERNMVDKNLKKIEEVALPIEAYNFVAFTGEYIYITSQKLNEILRYDLKTKKYIIKKLNHKNHNSNVLGNSLFSFDPYFRKMYVYNAHTFKLESETNLNVGFDRALAVDKNTILLRSAAAKYTKTILSAYDLKTKNNFKLKIQLNDSLEVDGGLKTDGFFTYKDSSIIYTQYKKGNFYRINKQLSKIIRHSTIDNIQKVEGVKISVDSSFYFEKPVLNSNLLSSISNDRFYLISFVKGVSDKLNQFTKYRMLDVYNLNTGKYIESFYLPNYGIDKPTDFNVRDNKIYLLFNSTIIIYELN